MAGMHDDYLQQQMESTLQKVFGISAAAAAQQPQQMDEAEQRPPSKRARPDEAYVTVRQEFPSTSIADFFNLNGAHPPVNRLQFASTSDLAFPPQQQPSNSETWARLLAAGTTNSLSPLSQLDEAFVEVFADKVATKVVNALSPQIQQIRTAIIGLARLVETNPPTQVTSSMGEKRTQSPATPIPLSQQTIADVAASVASTVVPSGIQQVVVSNLNSTTTAPIVSTKKRNLSPSKAEGPMIPSVNVPVNENEAPVGVKATSATKSAANGPATGAAKTDKKTGDGKSNPKRSVKEVPDMYRIIKLDDLAVHFNMTEKLCLLCRETFTESHLHSVKRHMYRKHRIELDTVLQRKTNDPTIHQVDKAQLAAGDLLHLLHMKTDLVGGDGHDQNELIDVVEVGNVGGEQPPKFQSGIQL